MKPRLLQLYDLMERVAWTFAQGFASAAIITGKLDLFDLKIAAGAGIIAVLKWVALQTSFATAVQIAKASPATTINVTASGPLSPPG